MAVSLHQSARYHPYVAPANHPQRVFKPVVLFNSFPPQQPGLGSVGPPPTLATPSFDPTPQLESVKVRINDMLLQNAQYWQTLWTFTQANPAALGLFHTDPSQALYTNPYGQMGGAPMMTHQAGPSHTSGGPIRRPPSYAMGGPHLPYHFSTNTPMSNLGPSIIAAAPTATPGLHPNKGAKKRRGNLPKAVTAILKAWLLEHVKHPYPTEEEKIALAHETELSLNQISNWFINARRRILQPILDQCAKSPSTEVTQPSVPTSMVGPVHNAGGNYLSPNTMYSEPGHHHSLLAPSSTHLATSIALPGQLPSHHTLHEALDPSRSAVYAPLPTSSSPLNPAVRTVNVPMFKQRIYEQISNTGIGSRSTNRDKYKTMAKV